MYNQAVGWEGGGGRGRGGGNSFVPSLYNHPFGASSIWGLLQFTLVGCCRGTVGLYLHKGSMQHHHRKLVCLTAVLNLLPIAYGQGGLYLCVCVCVCVYVLE